MLTAAGYFNHARVFGILAILAAILVVSRHPARTNAMRALVIVCHTVTLLSGGVLSEDFLCDSLRPLRLGGKLPERK